MDKDPDKPTLNRLLKYISPDVPTIAVAVGALLVSSGANIALPSILGKILDSSSKAPQNPQQNPIFNDPTFKNSIFKALGVFAVGALSSWLRVYCFSIAQERIASRLRGDLFEALLKRKQEQIDIDPEHSTGAVLHVLDEDVVIAAEVFTENLAVGLRALNSSVNGSILLLSISPKLTLVSLAVVPFVGAGAMMFSRFVQQETKKLHHAQNKAFSFASERISQSRMVSLFHREAFEAHQFRQKLGDVFAVSQKVAVAEGRFRGALTMGLNVSALAVLFYGGTLVSQGELTLGKLTSFVMYSGMVGLGFSSIAAFTSSMSKALSSAARVFRHIDAADSKGISSFFPASRCSGHIKFENVTFSYPSRKDSVALKNISFELLPGQILGIAGSSGSGKTTITSLLARIYDLDAPRQGDILIDGMSIFDLDSSWIRDQIGVVEQGAALLSGTILDNIRYGDLSASNEQVVNAAKAANAHDFITCFPEGYLTQVGELGGQLSVRIAMSSS
jgi:ABC-type multidrug transport system fused ATPase/permease subunit